jgi:tetratricopeptide (TPR) repeat protein
VSDYQRTARQQALREAEGYLDLAMGSGEPWPLDQRLVVRLARRALTTLERIQHPAGQRAHALYLTGQAYRVMQEHAQAVPPLAAAAELEPENIAIWLALAWCYKRTQRLDLAIDSLENALAVEPRAAILYYNLACYWSLVGNAPVALQYLAQSFDIDPTYREMVAEETDFDPIRDLPDFQSLTSVIV